MGTVSTMNTTEWLANITDDSHTAIAAKAGISDRTLRHQIGKGSISVENVVRIANAYGQNPLRILINMGLADESWARIEDIEGALRRATDQQLTDEFLRRLKIAPNPKWDEPIGDLEAARQARQSNTQGEDTTPAVRDAWDDMPADAVADDSPEEGGTPDDYEP